MRPPLPAVPLPAAPLSAVPLSAAPLPAAPPTASPRPRALSCPATLAPCSPAAIRIVPPSAAAGATTVAGGERAALTSSTAPAATVTALPANSTEPPGTCSVPPCSSTLPAWASKSRSRSTVIRPPLTTRSPLAVMPFWRSASTSVERPPLPACGTPFNRAAWEPVLPKTSKRPLPTAREEAVLKLSRGTLLKAAPAPSCTPPGDKKISWAGPLKLTLRFKNVPRGFSTPITTEV